jgi:hypothetical protein
MKPWSDFHRLRKYARRKRRHPGATSILALYWRYHFKVHGPHECLWGAPVATKRTP